MKICVNWWLITLLSPVVLSAQDFSFRYGGYAKNLAIYSSSILTDDAYFFDVSRFRIKGSFNVGQIVHSEVWLDNELLAGDFLETQDFQLSQSLQRPKFVDLDWTLREGDSYQIRQSLFRAFATVYLKNGALTLGRQRIAWGTGYVWNPTDLLNPFNPAAIELEEKEGVDAVHVSVPLGVLSKFEAAFAPGRGELKSSVAARVSSNYRGYDFSLMAGDFQKDRVLGGDFAGYIGGAGFRGEFAYTFKENDDHYFRAILNTDYNFPNDLYVFAEFYFNGQGATNKANYDITDLFSGQTFNLAKYYLALSATKSVTPLFGVNLYSIVNLNDRSSLIGPAVTYSLATNLEIAGSAYFFLGPQGSEYGQLKSSYFAHVQFYF